jgi:hypothetical protein
MIVEFHSLVVLVPKKRAALCCCHAFPVIEAAMKSRPETISGEYSLWNTFTRKIIISIITIDLKTAGTDAKAGLSKYRDAHLLPTI